MFVENVGTPPAPPPTLITTARGITWIWWYCYNRYYLNLKYLCQWFCCGRIHKIKDSIWCGTTGIWGWGWGVEGGVGDVTWCYAFTVKVTFTCLLVWRERNMSRDVMQSVWRSHLPVWTVRNLNGEICYPLFIMLVDILFQFLPAAKQLQ